MFIYIYNITKQYFFVCLSAETHFSHFLAWETAFFQKLDLTLPAHLFRAVVI